MPPSEMTPYLVAKQSCLFIKKKQSPNTFDNILGAHNISRNKKAIYYIGKHNDFPARGINSNNPLKKNELKVNQSTPNLRLEKEAEKNNSQVYGESIADLSSKYATKTLVKGKYNKATLKTEMEDEYSKVATNRLTEKYGCNSMTANTKTFSRNRNVFFGIFDEEDLKVLNKKLCIFKIGRRESSEI